MSTNDPDLSRAPGATATRDRDRDSVQAHRSAGGTARQRRGTETKAAFKTTELIAYVAAVAAVLIAALIVDNGGADGGDGGFGARQAWLYVTILTVGYMISRGLAKSGSKEPYWDEDGR